MMSGWIDRIKGISMSQFEVYECGGNASVQRDGSVHDYYFGKIGAALQPKLRFILKFMGKLKPAHWG